MTTITLTIELPETLAAAAREAGILSNERIAALLEMELTRQAAWDRLNAAAARVRESAAGEYGHLSDEEVMRLVGEEVALMQKSHPHRNIAH